MGALKKTVEQLEQLHNKICGVWNDNTQWAYLDDLAKLK